MAYPCKRCGATKTEVVHRGLRKRLVQSFGYELRKCARCRRLRIIERGRWQPAASNGGAQGGTVDDAPSQASARPFRDPDGFNGCPKCGELRFDRSRRTWLELKLLGRPPMARCASCGYRFPVPQV